jgi:hypothetical protein
MSGISSLILLYIWEAADVSTKAISSTPCTMNGLASEGITKRDLILRRPDVSEASAPGVADPPFGEPLNEKGA